MPRFPKRLLATVLAGVAAGALVQAVPASANTPANCHANWTKALLNDRLSEAVYCTDGEWLGVHDEQADGYSARAAVQLWHSGTGRWQDTYTCFDDTTVSDYQGWSFCDFSITDGTLVRIRLWSQRNGVEDASSVEVTGSFTT